jgi:hypothetical protein
MPSNHVPGEYDAQLFKGYAQEIQRKPYHTQPNQPVPWRR